MTKRRDSSSVSGHKKAIVLFTDQPPALGYVNAAALGREDHLDLLTQDGEVKSFPLAEIKSVCFLREFTGPHRLERSAFLSRPKLNGLWIRLRFRDGESVEGIVPNDLLDLLDAGIHLTPPDLRGNVIRMFVPRMAAEELIVLGVIGPPRRPSAEISREKRPAPAPQSELFD